MKISLSVLGFLFCTMVSSGQEPRKIRMAELEKIMQESRGPVIINFWATWCKPCVEEIPYFLEELKDHKKDSLQLLLVSLDSDELYPGALSEFVNKRNYNRAEVFWLDETNADYFCPKVDEKWSGAIPATLFLHNKTGYRKFYEEQVSHKQLKEEIKTLIKQGVTIK